LEDPRMIKHCMIALMTLALVAPLYSQEKKAKDGKTPVVEEKKKADDKAATEPKPAREKEKLTVYQEVVLEDFETTPYTDKNVTFNVTSDQEAKISIRDQLSASPTSKKYLGLKVKTRGGDIFMLKPAKDLILDKHCKSISFWIYGKKTYGKVAFMLQDTKKMNHVLIICPAVDFLGWKQFTVLLDRRIAQDDDFLNQKKTMQILNIQYTTAGVKNKLMTWEYIYLDDITATVRERYDDKQSDEW
jgi:hypothetical protein